MALSGAGWLAGEPSTLAATEARADADPLGALYDQMKGATPLERAGLERALAHALEEADLPFLALVYHRAGALGDPDQGRRSAGAWLRLEQALGPDLRATGLLAVDSPLIFPLISRPLWRLLHGAARALSGADAAADLTRVKGDPRAQALYLLGMSQEAQGDRRAALTTLFSAAEAAEDLQQEEATEGAARREAAAQLERTLEAFGGAPPPPDLTAPPVEPPMPATWLVPHPRRQALYAQGRVALDLSRPDVALAYLAPLSVGGPLSRDARLLIAIAHWNSGAMAEAISILDELARGKDLIALHAMLTKRDLTPEVQERGFLTGRMRELFQRLDQRLRAFADAHRGDAAGALAALRAQEAGGAASLPADVLQSLELDPLLTGLRRRLRSIELDRLRWAARPPEWRASPVGVALGQRLDLEARAVADRCGRRTLETVEGLILELDGLKDQLRPPDIREQIFSPSYFTL